MLCAISGSSAAVEVPPPILPFITVYTIHSRQNVVCTAVGKEWFILVGVTSPIAIGHCSRDNPFALPHPATVFPVVAVPTLHGVQGFTMMSVALDIEESIPVILVRC